MATLSSSVSVSADDATENSSGTVSITETTNVSFKTTARKYIGYISRGFPIVKSAYVHEALFAIPVNGPTKTTITFDIAAYGGSAANVVAFSTGASNISNRLTNNVIYAGKTVSLTTDANTPASYNVDITDIIQNIVNDTNFPTSGTTDFCIILTATTTTNNANATLNFQDGGYAATLSIKTPKTKTINTTGTAPLDWGTSSHWTVTGGSAKQSTNVPDFLDDVVGAAGSLSMTIASSTSPQCRSFDLNAYVNTFTDNSAGLYIGILNAPNTAINSRQTGLPSNNIAFRLGTSSTFTSSYIYFWHWVGTGTGTETISTAQQINFNGKTPPNNLNIYGGKYTFTHTTSLTNTSAALQIAFSDVNFNSKTYSLSQLYCDSSTITFGTSTFTLSKAGGSTWNHQDFTDALWISGNSTFTGTPTITCNGASAKVAIPGGYDINNLSFTGTGNSRLIKNYNNNNISENSQSFTSSGGTASITPTIVDANTIGKTLIAAVKCTASFSVNSLYWNTLLTKTHDSGSGLYTGIFYRTSDASNLDILDLTTSGSGSVIFSVHPDIEPTEVISSDSYSINAGENFKVLQSKIYNSIDGEFFYFFNASLDTSNDSITMLYADGYSMYSNISVFYDQRHLYDQSDNIKNWSIGFNEPANSSYLNYKRIISIVRLRPKKNTKISTLSVTNASNFYVGADLTNVGSLTLTGTVTAPLNVRSSFDGSQRKWSRTVSPTNNVDYVNFADQNFGTAIAYNGTGNTSFGNIGGNTNITFDPATTMYWVGGTGNWNTAAKWATTSGGTGGTARIPLPQDAVIFDDSSGTAPFTATATLNIINVPKITSTVSGSNSLTLTTATTILIYDDIVLSSKTTLATTSLGNYRFAKRGNQIFNLNGGTNSAAAVYQDAVGGTTTITGGYSNSSVTSSFGIRNGTVIFDGDVTVGLFFPLTANTGQAYNKNVTFANNSNLNILGVDGTFAACDFQGIIPQRNNINIYINNTTASSTKTLYLASTSDGTGVINNINFATNATNNIYATNKTLFGELQYPKIKKITILKPGYLNLYPTIELDELIALGTDLTTNAINIYGNIYKTFGILYVRYCIISGSTVSGGASAYAANSTDSGGNTGWVFTKVPYPGVLTLPRTQNPRSNSPNRSHFI